MLIPSTTKTGSSREDIVNMYPELKKYCLRITRNCWDAEDLAHDTIAKSISFCQKKWPENREVSFSFLATIARNQWIDHIRKQSRQSAEMILEPQVHDQPNHRLLEGIDSLIEKLTPKQLIVFVMKEIFEFPLADISQMLEMNETTVKSLLHRARRNINGDSAVPSVEQYWSDVELSSFRNILLHAIRLEKPESLQELAQALTLTQHFVEQHKLKLQSVHVTSVSSISSLSSYLCAA
ncbi:RNA polymerase sigma factor [Paenibacillus pini]|uniref:RNA polymerase ECF-type sigma factor n=1 Tax=Paenibacillus pini JCM 16418 TaxID=1236976 RepID=W7Z044_9BACL|nr:RNA polymerase sigma factor [Paenibacillus pini]GAF07989.1 RNA polymerase ECF-type sigma factor [Paenibacillus pini JCM 16418]